MAYSLADAAALVPDPFEDSDIQTAIVPFTPIQRTADDSEKGLAYMDVNDFVSKVIVPPEEQRTSVTNTFQDFVAFYSAKFSTEDDLRDTSRGAIESLKEIHHLKEVAAKQSADGHSLIGRLVKKGLIRIVKWVLKKAIRTVVRMASWAFRRIIIGGIEGMLEWMVRPVLMEVLGFIGLNPELWPFVAALGGIAALGYGAYKLFFDKSSDNTKDLTDDERQDLADQNTAVATANRITDVSPHTGAAYPRAANAPEVAGAPATNLAALISRGEGSYNSVNRGAAHGYRAGVEDLEHMTLGQVMAHQQAQDFNAVGKYQIIKPTLAAAVKALGLNGSEIFDRTLQDRIFYQYLIGQKRHQIEDYISGRSDNLVAAVLAASQEWASVAAPVGARLASGAPADGHMSYYAGTANNRASISAAEMAATIQSEREKRLGATNTTTVADHPVVTPGVAVAPPPTNAQKAQLQAQRTPSAVANSSSDDGTVIKKGRHLIKVAA
jgi:hypothetical protein